MMLSRRLRRVTEMPPAVPWTPAEITTALWLDADDPDTLWADADQTTPAALNDPVLSWADKSGNGYDHGQGFSSNAPTRVSGALRFDGSNDRIGNSSIQIHTGEWSAFAVAKSDVTSGGHQILAQDQTSVSFSRVAQYLKINDATSQTIGFNTAAAPFVASGSGTVTSLHITGGVRSSTFITHYFNGTAGTPLAVSGTAKTGNQFSTVGARNSTGTSTYVEFWDGDIAEIILVNGAVDTTTRQLIEGYLAWKWGLQANLPSGHPYEFGAPTV